MSLNKVLEHPQEMVIPRAQVASEVTLAQRAREWVRPIPSITILAWLVRLISLVNIVNALVRYQPQFIYWLGKWVPFEISEGHRIRMFLTSVLLFVLASGLERGKRLAWQLTMAGLLLAPILHLGRGVVWPQAVVNLVLIAFLFAKRRYFVVGSNPRSIRFAFFICPVLALALLIFGTIRLHALHKHTVGDHSWPACIQTAVELVFVHNSHTQQAITSHSQDLFVLLRTGGTSVALLGLVLVLRPVLLERISQNEQRKKARKLVARHGNDTFDSYALLNDKSYFFTANGRAMISYALSGKLAVVLADPIGPAEERPAAIAEFSQFCRHLDWEPVFYNVAEKGLSFYAQAGFAVFKIGEEARLRADAYELKGRDYQNLRTACNMARKLGITFRWYETSKGVDEALERQLAEISRQWLEHKQAREMAFDMGAFSLSDIRKNGAAVAIDAKGSAVAFATWRPFAQGAGRALDLMRSLPNARNVMDFALVQSIFHFRELGINEVSLGNAPLANAEPDSTPMQAEAKAVQFLFENLNQIYGYKSLFEFKRKYRPKWEGRYVAYRRGVHLPLVGLALVAVHTPEGIWSMFRRFGLQPPASRATKKW